MRRSETLPHCELCGVHAEYCQTVPDENAERRERNRSATRLQPLCFFHAVERRQQGSAHVAELLVVEDVGHLDRDRCGGDVVCADCGKKFYDHPQFEAGGGAFRFLNILCDGSLVKL